MTLKLGKGKTYEDCVKWIETEFVNSNNKHTLQNGILCDTLINTLDSFLPNILSSKYKDIACFSNSE